MRTLLAVFCVLLILSASVEARKKKPASQNTVAAKDHQAQMKKYAKAHKAPKAKRHQTVN